MMRNATRSTANGCLSCRSQDFPDVSIIVVGYNSFRYLNTCFAALAEQQYPGNVQHIFVDNQSGDESIDFMRTHYPNVTAMRAERNNGYAGGNNFGAGYATGSVLVFLNPDTKVDSSWLVNLVRPLLGDDKIGLTTSKILMMSNPSVINTCGNEVSFAGITWCRGANSPASDYTSDADVSAVSGCAFAIRRDLFEQLGGFDERFFMYLEDTDISWRARVAGFRCRYVADSIVYHDYNMDLTPWKIGLIEQNRYRMLGKHLSLRGIVGLAPALVSAEILTWGYAALRGRRSLLAKARATAWAFTQIGPVVRTRWRPIEGSILRDHAVAPPVVEGLGGRPSRIAQRGISVISRATTALSLRLLPAADATSGMPHRMTASTNGWHEEVFTINGRASETTDHREHSGVGLQ